MRGQLKVKAGTYSLAREVTLFIHASDAGTVIRLDDRETNRRYCGVIDETGQLVWPVSSPSEAPAQLTAEAEPALVDGVGKSERACRKLQTGKRAKPPRRIKFILKYSPKYRPRNSAYVVAAFMDRGADIHVLYRVEAAGTVYYENQLQISTKEVLLGHQIRAADRLSKGRWPQLIEMPDHGMLKKPHLWRKMSRDEISKVIEGRTFEVSRRDPHPE